MPLDSIIQESIIQISETLRLRTPKKEEWSLALPWYGNPKVMYLSEGKTQGSYKIEDIQAMYGYLSTIGELYFIEILEDQWKAIGDVTLSPKTLPIVIGNEKYWGQGISKRVMSTLIERARKVGLTRLELKEIYSYNERSHRLFTSLGFEPFEKTEKGQRYRLVL